MINLVLEVTATYRRRLTGLDYEVIGPDHYPSLKVGNITRRVGNLNGLDKETQIDLIADAFRWIERRIHLTGLKSIEPSYMEPALV